MKRYDTDMHIPTHYSDGQESPADIVRQAQAFGYEKIAITDHDGTDGIAEALEEGGRCGLCVIPGIEIATQLDGTGLHILGYDIDPDDPVLKAFLKELRDRRDVRNAKLIALLRDKGYDVTEEDLRRIQPNDFIGKPVIARALVDRGYAEDTGEVFSSERFFASPEARAIKKEKPSAYEAIDVIKKAGGYAVLAHPIQTRHIGEPGSEEFYETMDGIVKDLSEHGLAGLECVHPDQDAEQSRRFAQMAKKYGLIETRGSDFHGKSFDEA